MTKPIKGRFFKGLPDVLRIGPFDTPIKVVNEISKEGEWGLYEHGIAIHLNENQPSAAFAIDTFLHEINHGIYRNFNLDEKSSEEAICASMATGWLQVLIDNPQILIWLLSLLPGNKK